MQVDLEPDEIEAIVESLDCLKTKIAFTKGLSATEKNERIRNAEALEAKLRRQRTS
jgi:hypothetical protein